MVPPFIFFIQNERIFTSATRGTIKSATFGCTISQPQGQFLEWKNHPMAPFSLGWLKGQNLFFFSFFFHGPQRSHTPTFFLKKKNCLATFCWHENQSILNRSTISFFAYSTGSTYDRNENLKFLNQTGLESF
jgi:hypothetical protein